MTDGAATHPTPAQPAHTQADPSESPAEALSAAFETAAAAFRASTVGDQRVMAAFALGWQMAEVYRPESRRTSMASTDDDLPEIEHLGAVELQAMGLLQVQAGITKLRPSIAGAGLEEPDAERFALLIEEVDDPRARRRAIRAFHIDLLATLSAADFRLGKAYGLGRALADATQSPRDWQAGFASDRVAIVATWIRELASVLPPHAAHPVAQSLGAWSRWAQKHEGEGGDTRQKLPAQGRLWRSLLSGEKEPTEVLEIGDYLSAGEGMLQRNGELAGKFLRHYWRLVTIAIALLGVGIWLIVGPGSGIAAGLGAATIFTSVGLSWKGLGSSLGKAGAHVEEPLWQAELDQAIYERITPDEIVQSQRNHKTGPDEPSLVTRNHRRTRATQPVTPAQDNTTPPPSEHQSGSESPD